MLTKEELLENLQSLIVCVRVRHNCHECDCLSCDYFKSENVDLDVAKQLAINQLVDEIYEAFNATQEKATERFLQQWYMDSVNSDSPPTWSGEHIKELVKDFYVIKK